MAKNTEKVNEFLQHENNCLKHRVRELEVSLSALIEHCNTIEEPGVVVEAVNVTLNKGV